MIPKKPKQIINQVSEELDLPVAMVDDIVSLYFKSLRRKLSDLEDTKINVSGLGHFLIKQSGVNKAIKKYESMNQGMATDTFINYHNKKTVLARLDKLYEIRNKIDEFVKKKKSFKNSKNGQ